MDLHPQALNERGIVRPDKSILRCLLVGLFDHMSLKGLRGLDLPKRFPLQGFQNGSIRVGPS